MRKPCGNSQESGPDPMFLGFGAIVLGIGAWIHKNSLKIKIFHFNNYEEIDLIAWGLVLLALAAAIFYIKKKTKSIAERGRLLSPLWDQHSDNILVGLTSDKVELHLSDEKRCTHVQIIGTTGRGKTHSVVVPWVLRDLIRNKSVVLIDGKGSPDVPLSICTSLEEHGIKAEVLQFDLDLTNDSVQINPLKSGTPQQITDRIFSAFEFNETFYRAVQYDTCGYLMRLIKETGNVPSFKLLYELLTDDKELSTLLKDLDDKNVLKKNLIDYLKTPLSERRQKMAGLTSQISPFAVGEISELVNGGINEVLISDVINSENSKLLIMSISTLKYQQIGHQLGKLVLQELAWSVGEREKNEDNKFCSVFLDEFSEFVYPGFVRILNKARSAKVALHLSHQSMSDLSAVSPDFARSINTNTNIKCILGLNDPDTADFYAKHLGTFTTNKLTEQIEERGFFKQHEETGRGSRREVESYKVHPNDLKEFFDGKGVLHVPTERGSITEVIQFYPINYKEESLVNA